jgi:FKBP-type peptidyl-prolyl cis-trans isomerase SlyD
MQIADNTVASFDYTLTDDDGRVIDSSDGRQPLTYLHGVGQLIPGLETALEGQSEGDELAVTVAPDDAYGEHNERLVQDVPRSAFDSVEKVEEGARFQMSDSSGATRIITVKAIGEETVTIDANHPLAGKPLNFELRVVEVRAATDEEIETGKVGES